MTGGLGASASAAAESFGRTLPSAGDTKELIIGRVKRTTEKKSKVRVRKDLSRMQWVVETDDMEVSKITDRHRKKKGVDMEGKGEDAAKVRAKQAIRAVQKAKESDEDNTAYMLKDLPPMEVLMESNLLQVLSTAKSFGGFSLTSKMIEQEKKMKEELASKLNRLNRSTASIDTKGIKVKASTGSTSNTTAVGGASNKSKKTVSSIPTVASKERLVLPDISSSRNSSR